jgi:hypothetical protein
LNLFVFSAFFICFDRVFCVNNTKKERTVLNRGDETVKNLQKPDQLIRRGMSGTRQIQDDEGDGGQGAAL